MIKRGYDRRDRECLRYPGMEFTVFKYHSFKIQIPESSSLHGLIFPNWFTLSSEIWSRNIVRKKERDNKNCQKQRKNDEYTRASRLLKKLASRLLFLKPPFTGF